MGLPPPANQSLECIPRLLQWLQKGRASFRVLTGLNKRCCKDPSGTGERFGWAGAHDSCAQFLWVPTGSIIYPSIHSSFLSQNSCLQVGLLTGAIGIEMIIPWIKPSKKYVEEGIEGQITTRLEGLENLESFSD